MNQTGQTTAEERFTSITVQQYTCGRKYKSRRHQIHCIAHRRRIRIRRHYSFLQIFALTIKFPQELLLRHNPDVNARNKEMFTPLFFAAVEGYRAAHSTECCRVTRFFKHNSFISFYLTLVPILLHKIRLVERLFHGQTQKTISKDYTLLCSQF